MNAPTQAALHTRRRAVALGSRLFNVGSIDTRPDDDERRIALLDLIDELPDALCGLALDVCRRLRHAPRDYERQAWERRTWSFRLWKASWRRCYPCDDPTIRAQVRRDVAAQRAWMATAEPLLARSGRRASSTAKDSA